VSLDERKVAITCGWAQKLLGKETRSSKGLPSDPVKLRKSSPFWTPLKSSMVGIVVAASDLLVVLDQGLAREVSWTCFAGDRAFIPKIPRRRGFSVSTMQLWSILIERLGPGKINVVLRGLMSTAVLRASPSSRYRGGILSK
jgi:hypothetical protein